MNPIEALLKEIIPGAKTIDQKKPVHSSNKDIIPITTKKVRTNPDGSRTIEIDFEPNLDTPQEFLRDPLDVAVGHLRNSRNPHKR